MKIDVDNQLKRFFEQEEVCKERILTKEEVECEMFYKETYKQNPDGHFVVALPFKGDLALLCSSKGRTTSSNSSSSNERRWKCQICDH